MWIVKTKRLDVPLKTLPAGQNKKIRQAVPPL